MQAEIQQVINSSLLNVQARVYNCMTVKLYSLTRVYETGSRIACLEIFKYYISEKVGRNCYSNGISLVQCFSTLNTRTSTPRIPQLTRILGVEVFTAWNC